jgi:hypothetical protein
VTTLADNNSLDIYRIGMKNEKICVVAVTVTVTNQNQNPDPHSDPHQHDAAPQNWTYM